MHLFAASSRPRDISRDKLNHQSLHVRWLHNPNILHVRSYVTSCHVTSLSVVADEVFIIPVVKSAVRPSCKSCIVVILLAL